MCCQMKLHSTRHSSFVYMRITGLVVPLNLLPSALLMVPVFSLSQASNQLLAVDTMLLLKLSSSPMCGIRIELPRHHLEVLR